VRQKPFFWLEREVHKEKYLLNELTNKRDDTDSVVFVGGWQIALVHEHNDGLVGLDRGKDDAVLSLLVFAVLIERLENQLGDGRAAEVEGGNVHLWQTTESVEERHGLA
jgi:hypothetical protein